MRYEDSGFPVSKGRNVSPVGEVFEEGRLDDQRDALVGALDGYRSTERRTPPAADSVRLDQKFFSVLFSNYLACLEQPLWHELSP